MPVPTVIGDLSTIAASNSPPGTESPTTTDDYLRTHASFIAVLRDDAASLAGRATAIEAEKPLGWGQTWQDVTASRAAGVTYTNTTGRPIFVLCSLDTGASPVLTINSIAVPLPETTGVVPAVFSFVVPQGSTYRTSVTGAGKWLELR